MVYSQNPKERAPFIKMLRWEIDGALLGSI